jgi:hypothetical protein
MKKTEIIDNAKKAIRELEYKRNIFIYHRYTKYIIDYQIEGDYIHIYSNLGVSRKVKKNHSNIRKLDKTIIKNKIDIAHKIDEYEDNSRERIMVILTNILLLCGTGAIVPLTLFIGSYPIFLLSIILFSLSVIASSIMGVNLYIKASEIQNLKILTGYKLENEFNVPHYSISFPNRNTMKKEESI